MWRRSEYERLFADAPVGELRGESTAFYLWSRGRTAGSRPVCVRRMIPARDGPTRREGRPGASVTSVTAGPTKRAPGR